MLGVLLWCANSPAHARAYDNSPTQGTLSSNFGWRQNPIGGYTHFHGGIDIAAPAGQPVYAPQAGRVAYSGPYGGYGNVVVLEHGDGLYTLYAHNSRLLVRADQVVFAGEMISRVGVTGHANGPHLHFEVRRGGRYISPLKYLATLQHGGITQDTLAALPTRPKACAAPAKAKKSAVVAAAITVPVMGMMTEMSPKQAPRRVLRPSRHVELILGPKRKTYEFE